MNNDTDYYIALSNKVIDIVLQIVLMFRHIIINL